MILYCPSVNDRVISLISNKLSTHLIPRAYPSTPILITDIEITPRQFDILAAFYVLKKTQLVGFLLGISHRGVEAHLYNIKQKLLLKRKDIVHFLDACSNIRNALEQHYRYLLIENTFQETLKSLRSKSGNQLFYCQWDRRETFPQDFPLAYIQKHLKSAGIEIVASSSNHKTVILRSDIILFSEPQHYYTTLISLLQAIFPQEKYQPYLQDFLKKQEDILSGSTSLSETQPIDQGNISLTQDLSWAATFKSFWVNPQYRIYYIIGVILTLLFTLLGRLLFYNTSSTPHSSQHIVGSRNISNQSDSNKISTHNQSSVMKARDIGKVEHHQHFYALSQSVETTSFQHVRSELMIPIEGFLLKRTNLIKKIRAHLMPQQIDSPYIRVIAIVGIGGTGKTTLARYYGQLQKEVDVVWELNAESRETLLNSMYELAYALAQNKQDREIYEDIQQIKNMSKKEKSLLVFLQNNLRKHNNWILIYDNVADPHEINDLFPQAFMPLEKGQVIITTRNQNIGRIGFIESKDVIDINQLSLKETLQLFCQTLYEQNLCKLSRTKRHKISEFLKNIPPFPLDIRNAALYIKATKTSFHKYLQELKNYDLVFESCIHEVLGHHTKTRYRLLAASFEKLIATDSRLKELLFFLTLSGSENIPKEYLSSYFSESKLTSYIFKLSKYGIINFYKNNVYGLHKSTHEVLKISIPRKITKTKAKEFFFQMISCLKNLFKKKKNQIFYSSFGNMYNAKAKYETIYLQGIINTLESMPILSKEIKNYAKQYILTLIGESYLFFYWNINLSEQFFISSKINENLKNPFITKSDLAGIYNTFARTLSLAEKYSDALEALKKEVFLCQNARCPRSSILDNHVIMGYNLSYLGRFLEADKHFVQVISAFQHKTPVSTRQKLILSRALCYRSMLYAANFLHKKSYHNFLNWGHSAANIISEEASRNGHTIFNEWKIRYLKNLGIIYLCAGLYEDPFMKSFQKLIENELELHPGKGALLHTKFKIFQIICELLLRRNEIRMASSYLEKAKEIMPKIEKDVDMHQLCLHLEILIRNQKFEEAYNETLKINRIKQIAKSNYHKLFYCILQYHAFLITLKVNRHFESLKYFARFIKSINIFLEDFLDQKKYRHLKNKNVFWIAPLSKNMNVEQIFKVYIKNSRKIFVGLYGKDHSFVKDYIVRNDSHIIGSR